MSDKNPIGIEITHNIMITIQATTIAHSFFSFMTPHIFRFTCKNGQKFVSKPDYAAGDPSNLAKNLFATCQITGWFNESIGSYTCTQNCGPPPDYSWLMKSNYSINQAVVPYGTKFL